MSENSLESPGRLCSTPVCRIDSTPHAYPSMLTVCFVGLHSSILGVAYTINVASSCDGGCMVYGDVGMFLHIESQLISSCCYTVLPATD